MKPGTYLVDADRREERFRVQRLLHAGKSYQIALAEDAHMDDKLVCVKAIAYDAGRIDERPYVVDRRKALHQELRFLAQPIHLIPEPLDWIQLEGSDTPLNREPVLVYEYIHGETLHEAIATRHPDGIAPTRALRIFREIVRFLGEIHGRGYVFRDLDPRHVVLGYDDIIHVVGCSNATPIGQPPNPTQRALNPAYAAPEIRGEQSGKLLRPAADFYSAGALLSFMLTGEEPRSSAENPLTKKAYETLSNLEHPGIALIVARCLHPMAKKRFSRAERLAPFCTLETLPTPTTRGFGLMQLPAPWTGAEPPDTRVARSQLSPGPLISVARDESQPRGEVAKKQETLPERKHDFVFPAWAAIVGLLVFAALAAALIFL